MQRNRTMPHVAIHAPPSRNRWGPASSGVRAPGTSDWADPPCRCSRGQAAAAGAVAQAHLANRAAGAAGSAHAGNSRLQPGALARGRAGRGRADRGNGHAPVGPVTSVVPVSNTMRQPSGRCPAVPRSRESLPYAMASSGSGSVPGPPRSQRCCRRPFTSMSVRDVSQ